MSTDAPTSTATADHRRMAAIMFSDIVGFSRQMAANESRMMRLLDVHNIIIQRAVAEFRGNVIKTLGDAFVVEFYSVVYAVQCAQKIQAELRRYNAACPPEDRIRVRIGVHLDDIIQQKGDVFGDGVNIASRLQTLAEPETICISQAVYQEVEKKVDLGTVISLGRPKLKNIVQRFPVYALLHTKPVGILNWFKWVWRSVLHSGLFVRSVIVGLTLLLVALAGLALWDQYSFPYGKHPRSIVVLAFDNLMGDPNQEFFSDGISEDLTTELARIPGMFVISRNSAFFFKGKQFKADAVARDLRVRYVLEGSVQRQGDDLRITAQLIDAKSGGSHLWADTYDRKKEDLFKVQDEIVEKIVQSLKLQLDKGVEIRRTTKNIDAFDLWLRGTEYFYQYGPKANHEARKFFEQAIAVDPTYADAYARLSWTYWLDWWWWSGTDKDLEKARELAEQAIELNDSLPLAHASLAYIYLFKKDHERALAEAEKAVAVEPSFALGYQAMADVLCFAGRGHESLTQLDQAMTLNPRAPLGHLNGKGFAHLAIGQHAQAIRILEFAQSKSSKFPSIFVNLAVAYSEVGRLDDAKTAVRKFRELSSTASLTSVGKKLPFKDPVNLERWISGLRAGGLPESSPKK